MDTKFAHSRMYLTVAIPREDRKFKNFERKSNKNVDYYLWKQPCYYILLSQICRPAGCVYTIYSIHTISLPQDSGEKLYLSYQRVSFSAVAWRCHGPDSRHQERIRNSPVHNPPAGHHGPTLTLHPGNSPEYQTSFYPHPWSV